MQNDDLSRNWEAGQERGDSREWVGKSVDLINELQSWDDVRVKRSINDELNLKQLHCSSLREVQKYKRLKRQLPLDRRLSVIK
jgi:hypothetical protein